ncbi:conserved hypothetical protein [Burkholderiales bacterium 8X]|nr:conserved hypothetical protein [Burkholderiales bacterium 8X]
MLFRMLGGCRRPYLSMSLPSRLRAAAPVAALSLLLGCSPTFNWREVPVGPAGAVALLPCKAERASRNLPLGAESVAIDMAGCEAGGATFAVARAHAVDAQQAAAWLEAWRSATRAQLAGRRLTESAAQLARAASKPAPARLDTAAAGTEADAAQAHMVWFAHPVGTSVDLYQATVIGRPTSPEAVGTFFEGLRLP